MKKWVWGILLLVACGVGALDLHAQEASGPSRADLAAYLGGAWTSPWLEAGDGTTFGIGFNPIVGAFGNFWLTPRFGVRLHGAYMPSDLPQPSTGTAFGPSGPIPGLFDGRLHNWFYDLNVAVRPFAGPARSGVLPSLYLFAGAGALTPNAAGGAGIQCVPAYVPGGACLPYNWRDATVPQVTAGIGVAALPITRNLGLFLEAAAHGYPSPFRIGQEHTGLPVCPEPACQVDDGGLAMTTRLVGGVRFAFGHPRPRVPPVYIPLETVPRREPEPRRPIMICVVEGAVPQYVQGFVRPETGDTVLVTEQGIERPLRAAYPMRPATAAGADWFIRDQSIFIGRREFVRFGVPRQIGPGDIRRVGEYQGTPLYSTTTADVATAAAPVIFVPVQDGCIFQPYQPRPPAIRG